MPRFGTRSNEKLTNAHVDLRLVLNKVIKKVDFTVIWTFRNEAQQTGMYLNGDTRNPWPTSKHNRKPSLAVDIVPYPAMYEATYEQFFELATYMFEAAMELDIPITWGGHWIGYTGKGYYDRDWSHWELKC